ncbi:YeiH family protein [Ktedonobacter racemifer]|uniref:Uncharacterized protein family UPF0324 n=1 Tax=Ktedonobacter racemifer DSM 44963 TaxID=485913 RepID=D6TZ38_KTERA|nr:putative sulfate exporter family transporter [Ktedonobacter racemifer]EFH81828.1 Uncharacterized protein family UPF0324 [Ktedonobacter racemifer DSM 44963]
MQETEVRELEIKQKSTRREIASGQRLERPKWPPFLLGLGLTVILGVIAMFLAPLPGLTIMGSLTVALLLGLLWRGTIGLPRAYTSGVRFSSQKLLRYGIILTGVRLNFGLLISGGVRILILDLVMILVGVGVLPWLAHRLGLSKRLAFLICVGQSICGASAVGALAAVMPDVDEDDASLAVAICGLIGTVGVLLYAFGGHLIGLTSTQYGLLAGSTLHEIAQVVAAGPAGGPGAADIAMLTKLTRVVLLAPVAVVATFLFSWRASRQAGVSNSLNLKKIPLPWFVLGFLLVGVINSLGFFSKDIAALLVQASTFLMVAAMAAMGLMVDFAVLRRRGLRALGVSLLLLAIFIVLSSAIIFLG